MIVLKKMFGNKIETNCIYCDNAIIHADGAICKLNRRIKNGKCKKFSYNPTMRAPLKQPSLQRFNKEDFTI